MPAEITQAHLTYLREAQDSWVPAARRLLDEYDRITRAMLTNPTHPPEPLWSEADNDVQRTALAAELDGVLMRLFFCTIAIVWTALDAYDDWTV